MTTTSRHWRPPSLDGKQKNTLEASQVTAVDGCLKALRKTRRGISSTVACFTTEREILDSVYYKSKNQHKNALFFRNIVEVRRLATRIEEANLGALLDTVRVAFYSNEIATSSALKSAPWTQLPNQKYLESVLHRLLAISSLHVKAFEVYLKASKAFTRFSHSTAFLPLVVTLLGISARLHALTIDLDHALRGTWDCIHQLLKETEISHNSCRCHLSEPVYHFELRPSNEKEELVTNAMAMDVDLGESIARPAAASMEEVMEVEQPMLVDEATLVEDEDTIQVDIIPPVIRTAVVESITKEEIVTLSKTSAPRVKKKKGKLRDEIDDIFG